MKKRKEQKNQMIALDNKKSKTVKTKKTVIVKDKDGGEALKIDNEIDLKEIVKSLELVKLKSDILTHKFLAHKEQETIEAVMEMSRQFMEVESENIKSNNCFEEMGNLFEEYVNDKFLNSNILEDMVFVFQTCIALAIADSFNNNSLKLVYDDDQPYVVAMGISVVAEGIYGGAKRALTGEDTEEYNEEDDEEGNGIDIKKTKIVRSLKERRLATYQTWEEMLSRCEDPDNPEYKNEGAKGITVCDRWNPKKGGSFENFVEDMGLIPD